MVKVILLQAVVLFGLWHVIESHRYTQSQLDLVSRVRFDQLPRYLQLMLKRGVKKGDNSNWCCKTNAEERVEYTQITKIVYHTIKESVQTHTQDSCGFLNFNKCETTNIAYVEKVVTYIDNQLVPNKSVCPNEQITCCNGYVLAADNCLEADGEKLNSLVDALTKLQAAGLLG